jgi:hypothetical protein
MRINTNSKIGGGVRIVLFFLILLVVFNSVSAMCESASYRTDINGYYSLQNYRSILDLNVRKPEVIAMGSSFGLNCYAPPELYKNYGINNLNISGSLQSIRATYHNLVNILKEHKPKVLLLETYMFYYDWSGIWYRLAIDTMRLSKEKVNGAKNREGNYDTDSSLSFFFPILKYHQTWKNLSADATNTFDANIHHQYFDGFKAQTNVWTPPESYFGFSGFTDTGTDKAEPYPEPISYIKKIVDLCSANNISLVLYKDTATDWTAAQHNAIQNLADSYGVPFIDFQMADVLSECNFDYTADLADLHHDNIRGAVKVSQYLGKYLHEHYDLTDYRRDADYAYLDNELARYEREKFNMSLVMETNMANYLGLLCNAEQDDYTVFFSIMDDGERSLGEELHEKLSAMGFESVFTDYAHSFIGIWQNGRVVHEQISLSTNDSETDALEYKGVLPDGNKVYVKSAGFLCGNVSNIIINGVDYSRHLRGFNIVIYDNKTRRVADSIRWDTHIDAGITFSR